MLIMLVMGLQLPPADVDAEERPHPRLRCLVRSLLHAYSVYRYLLSFVTKVKGRSERYCSSSRPAASEMKAVVIAVPIAVRIT